GKQDINKDKYDQNRRARAQEGFPVFHEHVLFYFAAHSFLLWNLYKSEVKKAIEVARMEKNILETLMGAVVLIVAAAFLVFAYEGSQIHVEEGYKIHANFSDASGITLGSDVRIGGVKIGVVSDLGLDPKTYDAVATLQIRRDTKLPKDSSAAI